jgi:ribosome maturation factor RimP
MRGFAFRRRAQSKAMASTARIQELLEPGARALGFEILAVELSGAGRSHTLRVYLDAPGGVTLDDCTAVSRQLSAILDVEDPLGGRYTLEVSSPGLDRPLTKPEHFRRFVGHRARIELIRARDGRRRFSGVLSGADDAGIRLRADDAELEVAYADIEKARLVPELKW